MGNCCCSYLDAKSARCFTSEATELRIAIPAAASATAAAAAVKRTGARGRKVAAAAAAAATSGPELMEEDFKATVILHHPASPVTKDTGDACDEQYIAFKIMTTHPDRYIVRPNLGLVAPGTSVEVGISIFEECRQHLVRSYQDWEHLGPEEYNGGKFMIQYCRPPADSGDASEITRLNRDILRKQQEWRQQEEEGGGQTRDRQRELEQRKIRYDDLTRLWKSCTMGPNPVSVSRIRFPVRHDVVVVAAAPDDTHDDDAPEEAAAPSSSNKDRERRDRRTRREGRTKTQENERPQQPQPQHSSSSRGTASACCASDADPAPPVKMPRRREPLSIVLEIPRGGIPRTAGNKHPSSAPPPPTTTMKIREIEGRGAAEVSARTGETRGENDHADDRGDGARGSRDGGNRDGGNASTTGTNATKEGPSESQ